MWTCDQLDLQTLGSQLVMFKNLPDHWSDNSSSEWLAGGWICGIAAYLAELYEVIEPSAILPLPSFLLKVEPRKLLVHGTSSALLNSTPLHSTFALFLFTRVHPHLHGQSWTPPFTPLSRCFQHIFIFIFLSVPFWHNIGNTHCWGIILQPRGHLLRRCVGKKSRHAKRNSFLC